MVSSSPRLPLLHATVTAAAKRTAADPHDVRTSIASLRSASHLHREDPVRIAKALALTDGAQYVTRLAHEAPPARHPLSGEKLELPGPNDGFREDPGGPATPEAWIQAWLTRRDRIQEDTGSDFPIANPGMPDHALWHRADFAAALADALDRDQEERPALLTSDSGAPSHLSRRREKRPTCGRAVSS